MVPDEAQRTGGGDDEASSLPYCTCTGSLESPQPGLAAFSSMTCSTLLPLLSPLLCTIRYN
jgi:hypothetical protein